MWISVRQAAKIRFYELELVLHARKMSQGDIFRIYTLPRVVGGFLQGIEIAIGLGWLAVVAAELIATYSQGFWAGGLGHRLFYSFSINDWQTGIAALLMFGFLGLVSSVAWKTSGIALFVRATGITPFKT